MARIAIDAMGGDFGPEPIVNGTLKALKEKKFDAILVGKRSEILPFIPKSYLNRITIVEADDVIDMNDAATDALKRRESSIYKAVELVRNKEADAVVSAGHSGATMSLATLRIGRLKHVSRPALVTLMPARGGKRTVLLDVGANTDCKAENLVEFAIMGHYYAHDVLKITEPRMGLLANGEEPSKGNEVTKEAFKKLGSFEGFIGNVEGNNIFDGSVDVVVCDGFIGNLVLKSSEGVASAISYFLKDYIRRSPIAITGALLMRKVFKLLKKEVDYAEFGGAPLVGINGCAIVSHGKSNSKAIKNAIFQAIRYIDTGVNTHIETRLGVYKEIR
jgi:phosphate acyltransferase